MRGFSSRFAQVWANVHIEPFVDDNVVQLNAIDKFCSIDMNDHTGVYFV